MGYHLPQKIGDLGLLEEKNVSTTDENPNPTPKVQSNPSVPNPLKEKEIPQYNLPNKTEKRKVALSVSEAYDMAKVFNAQLSA